MSWKNARVLHEDGYYDRNLLRRIRNLVKKPYERKPQYEIEVTKAWAQKELERCRVTDIQGLSRRAEFQFTLVERYFFVRQKRFWGPKEGFAWIEKNDPKTFNLIKRALKHPNNLSFLKTAASRVYKVSLS